jgi:hypothetical protein
MEMARAARAPLRNDAGADSVERGAGWKDRLPAIVLNRDVGVFALGACWLVFGAWLRYYQLGSQVLIEDEWHAVHKILRSDALGIATAFGRADYSIPLALYDRFLMLHGGLTEWKMRMPMFLSGIGLLLVAPPLVARRIDGSTRALWLGLLAVCPLLVFFSKTARPYSITVLAAFVAVVVVRRWWRGEGAHWAAAYGVAAWLAGYLHPITLAFTLLPLAYFGCQAIAAAAGGDRRPLLRVVALSVPLVLLLAATLGPPLYFDWEGLSSKARQEAITLDSVYRAWLMFAGSASPLVGAGIAACAGIGAISLWRTDREPVFYFAVLLVGYAIVVDSTGAASISHPLVQARYMLCVLPFVLLAAAVGAMAIVRRVAGDWSTRAQPAVVVALPLALYLSGPLPADLYYPNQFLGHERFQYDYDETHNLYVVDAPRGKYPTFYDDLAKLPPASVTLIEAPWNLESQFDPFPFYQRVHRQRVKVGMVTGVCGERTFGEFPESVTGLQMRNMAHLSAILRGERYGANYLVIHKTPWTIAPGVPPTAWPDMATCLPVIEARLGAPVFVDDQISVFALNPNQPSIRENMK